MARLLAGQGVERTDVAKNGNAVPITLSGGSDLLAAANKDRVALIVTAPAAAITLGLSNNAVTANNGIVVPPNTIFVLNGYSGVVRVIGTAAQVVPWAEI